jgi:hypothetical protein
MAPAKPIFFFRKFALDTMISEKGAEANGF